MLWQVRRGWNILGVDGAIGILIQNPNPVPFEGFGTEGSYGARFAKLREDSGMTTIYKVLATAVVLLAVSLGWKPGPALAGSEPALTPAQIEADWLRQEELRGPALLASGGPITPEEDARGGCDGVKNGKWGFHTEFQADPWWQVDLGQSRPLERILLYNRSDLAERAARVSVLLSDDGQTWRQVYQHDGTPFYGYADGKPLEVALNRAQARYVRLQLPGPTYFHLDEVEIYGPGSPENLALGQPATQSSVSPWSARHRLATEGPEYAVAPVVERGLKLAQCLQRLGADVAAEETALRAIAERLKSWPSGAPEALRRSLYLQAHWTVRRMALRNPLLDFDSILFVQRAPSAFPHMSDQFYGWWSRPGGGLYLLQGFRGESPQLRPLTEGWPEGNFQRPDLSYDGKKAVFAYCQFFPGLYSTEKVDKAKLPEAAFYHIYELDLASGQARRLTWGKYDDFDPCYLPDGDIVFLSTRKGQPVQCTVAHAAATQEADLPDSYVRCGGDSIRPVPVFTLHRMDGQGGHLRPISAFENFEWTPTVANDGQILYARWDYIDRFNGPFMSLWATPPDGSCPQLVYGNFTVRPQCVFEARSIPGSHRLVFTAAAHHSNIGGSLVRLDPYAGNEFERPLTRLTPEVCFPETEGWPDHYYANPYPLSEEFFLVAWSDRPLPPHAFVTDDRNPPNSLGLYLYDAFGNLELLFRNPQLSSMYPIPLRPRPPLWPDRSGEEPAAGYFLVLDVYQGLSGVPRGTVKSLRIVGVPPKVQPYMNSPMLGVSSEDPGKFVLGTVPVEEDGSAYFPVPSGVPVFFQALDGEGLALQTMRTLTYVQPRQTLSCLGCHEPREQAPAVPHRPRAALREPSPLMPGPPGTWPWRFEELVQPVLDRHCVRCHRPDSDDGAAARFDLTMASSYANLLAFGDNDLKNLALERDRSVVGEMPARRSKLLALLRSHHGVRLEADSWNRLVTWMDVYAQKQGSFSAQQEEELRQLRHRWAFLWSRLEP